MARHSPAIACAVFVVLVTGCDSGGGGGGDPAPPDPTQGFCPSNRYVADLEGAPGTAQLFCEIGLNVVYVGGEVTSAYAYYTFTGCELYRDPYSGAITNSVCWVDVVDGYSGDRFRAEMQFYDLGGAQGFLFIANAYEGAYSTTYDFVCQ